VRALAVHGLKSATRLLLRNFRARTSWMRHHEGPGVQFGF
jgi:hypothetical protein